MTLSCGVCLFVKSLCLLSHVLLFSDDLAVCCYIVVSVLEYVQFGELFTLWNFHGAFPEQLVKIYIAEMAMVIGLCLFFLF